MKPLRTKGFVAVQTKTRQPYIMTWSTRHEAKQVRDAVVENWPDRNGQRPTWKDVMREGVRVCKVEIETV